MGSWSPTGPEPSRSVRGTNALLRGTDTPRRRTEGPVTGERTTLSIAEHALNRNSSAYGFDCRDCVALLRGDQTVGPGLA